MAPRFTIGRTVLVHGVGYFIPPAIMLGVYYGFGYNTTDEEKRKMLEVKYEHQIRKAEAGNKNMQAFFDKVKAEDEELDQRLNEVLQAGNKKSRGTTTWTATSRPRPRRRAATPSRQLRPWRRRRAEATKGGRGPARPTGH